MTSSQTQASRRILKALTVFDLLLDVNRNFGVNGNLDYGTLLKVMVEIYYNVNRAQAVSYTQKLLTIHDTSHFSWETLRCVMVPTKYKRRNENH